MSISSGTKGCVPAPKYLLLMWFNRLIIWTSLRSFIISYSITASLFIIFMATVFPVTLHLACETQPYDPLPMTSTTSYFLFIANRSFFVIPYSSFRSSFYSRFFISFSFLDIFGLVGMLEEFSLLICWAVPSVSLYLLVALVDTFDYLNYLFSYNFVPV